MVAASMDPATINKLYAVTPNKSITTKEGAPQTALGYVVNFTKTAYGAFRTLQLTEKVLKVASEIFRRIGHFYADVTKSLAKNIAAGWSFLAIPRLPEVFKDAKDAILNWRNKPEGKRSYIADKSDKAGTVAEAVATTGFAVTALTGSEKVLNTANVFDLIKNSFDLLVHGEDYTKAKQLYNYSQLTGKAVDAKVQNRIVETMRHKVMLIAKTVFSIASGTLGLLALALGAPLVPAVALLAMGVTGTVLALWSHFYKETRSYELIDFTKIPA